MITNSEIVVMRSPGILSTRNHQNRPNLWTFLKGKKCLGLSQWTAMLALPICWGIDLPLPSPPNLQVVGLFYLQNNMFHPRPGPRRDLQYHDACDIPQNLISKVQKRLIQSNQKKPPTHPIGNRYSKWIIIVVGNPMSQLLEVIL